MSAVSQNEGVAQGVKQAELGNASAPTLLPHPFQVENVRKIVERTDRRFWVLDETGLGKSVTAILAAKQLQCRTVLVVTKALVRPAWKERFAEWWPDYVGSIATITMGSRKSLSKPAQERLSMAYGAGVQIVSPDLLSHVRQDGWDIIILDEMHEYVSYRSAASKQLRKLFEANPGAYKLGLSATPLSAEPKNAWNLLQMFWPEKWGKATRTGEPPYWFCNTFCERMETVYGVAYYGLNTANADKFALAIQSISARTLRSDVQNLLPSLDISPIVAENNNKKSDIQLAVDWSDIAIKESFHVCILAYHRDTVTGLSDTLHSLPRYRDVAVFHITGADTPERRVRILQEMRKEDRAILLGTMDALGTGISLTFCNQWLMIEPPSTASKIVQAIGRFVRLDSPNASRGFILLREDREGVSAKLRERLGNMDRLIKNGQGEQVLAKVLEPDPNAFDRWLDGMVESYRGDGVDNDDDDGL